MLTRRVHVRCRPDQFPPHDPPGQALVEFALMTPVLLLLGLGFVESAFLLHAQADQDRATGVVADWTVNHPSEAPDAVVARLGLAGCDLSTSSDNDVLTVDVDCAYNPVLTAGLRVFDNVTISTEASAAIEPSPSPSPSLEPSEEAS